MRVSRNEVYRMAQRALDSVGAAYGVDRDGAAAVAWLEARGLPGVELLVAALDRLPGAFEPLEPPREEDGRSVIDLAGRPSLACPGTLIDYADLVADQGRALVVHSCRWPIFLLAAAAQRPEGSRPLTLRWSPGEGCITGVVHSGSSCRIVGEGLSGDLAQALRDGSPADVTVTASRSNVRTTERATPAQVLGAEALDEALQRSLADGIAVDPAVWTRASEAAKQVLVPPSDTSRSRGAGGGDDND